MTLLLLSDLDIAARTIAREAGGEDFMGKLAVANVFKNRLETKTGQFRKDDTLATVCLRHVQFSVWNSDDVNFKKLYELSYSEQVMLDCMDAVCIAFKSSSVDPTNGARHYHTIDVSPNWIKGHIPCFKHGRHIFYNDIK